MNISYIQQKMIDVMTNCLDRGMSRDQAYNEALGIKAELHKKYYDNKKSKVLKPHWQARRDRMGV